MRFNKREIIRWCGTVGMLTTAQAASAIDFDIGNGWTGDWVTTISVGSSWRAEDPSPLLYTAANGAEVGLSGGMAGGAIDTGNVNYFQGDRFSTLFKVISEVSLSEGDRGIFVRGKAWYDQALKDGDVRYGNFVNGYHGGEPMKDDGFDTLNKFSGVYLLDAYAYDAFDVGQETVQVRAGRQAINWGESLFIQGVNQFSPIDVPSFRRPGAQIKEVLLPVWAFDISTTLGDYGSLEAFYQLKWDYTPIESCGNYWDVNEAHLAADVYGCFYALPVGPVSARQAAGDGGTAPGLFLEEQKGHEPKDSGQYGVAYRFTVEALNYTEFGLYAQNLHARTPGLGIRTGDCTDTAGNDICAAAGLLNPINAFGAIPGVTPAGVYWEYAEDIKIFGLSAATNIRGWSVSSELSYTKDLPAQITGGDVVNGFLTGLGPLGPTVVAATAKGITDVPTTVRTDKTQFQINTLKVGNGLLGAAQYIFLAEAGAQWTGANDEVGGRYRYGRGFIYGVASHPLYDLGTPSGGNVCDPTHPFYNPSPAGCRDDGFVTDFSWGYRAYMQLEYSNMFNSGVSLFPILFFSHDVEGNSVDSQFVEDRMTISPSLRLSYQKKYTFEMTYARYANSADYDGLSDHDFYSVNLAANF